MTVAGFEIYPPILLLGLVVGLTYGLLAVGLVVVHRTSRVLNLAHAQIGVFAAVVLAFLVVAWGVPYWLAFGAALIVGGLTGAIAEIAAVRRLTAAPPVMSFVVTLGLSQVLTFLSLHLYTQVRVDDGFPQPPGFPTLRVGALLVSPAFSALLFAAPLSAAAIAVFFRTPWGLAVRAAAADARLARLTAISPARTSLLAWAVAGALSALTAGLVIPVLAPLSPDLSGLALLLRAVAAAVVARMHRIGVALGTGVAIGVVEQVYFWNYPRGALQELLVAGLVLVAVATLRAYRVREQDVDPRWRAVQAWRPALPGSPAARRVRTVSLATGAVGVVVAATLIAVLPSTAAVTVPVLAAYAVVGMSVMLVTGLAGELSLGQFALAALGAVASIRITHATGNFFLGFSGAVLVGLVAAAVLGAPVLRLRRVVLPATTLAFAVATHLWLLPQPWALGEGIDPGRPVIGALRFDTFRSYAYLALVLLVVAVAVVTNVTAAGTRRRFVAVRDNEAAARAFGIDPSRTTLLALAIAGGLAGFAGAVYAHLLPAVRPADFPLDASISVVAIAALGGLSWSAGPLLGALWVLAVPRLLGVGDLVLATTAFGWLVLVLYVPGGLAHVVAPLRGALVRGLATTPAPAPPAPAPPAPAPGVSLQVERLACRFGGIAALDDVSLQVQPGETVALVGPNGAGKTTLLDVVGGFTRPDAGRVLLDGVDVTGRSPQQLARLGVVRSFQSSQLFATLTVLEVVALGLERSSPTRAVAELVGSRRRYRQNLEQAAQTAHALGLSPYLDRYVHELSSGMRRITELACVLALRPRLLLLDEPSAGVAQAELPHLATLLRQVCEATGAAVLLVEHNAAVIGDVADRAVALHLGRVVAHGKPGEVLTRGGALGYGR